MELEIIDIDPDEARVKLAEYQESLREDRNAEDAAIAAGYRAAARGLPVISLQRTIAAGGWHENGLPRMAAIRAATLENGISMLATECFARWDGPDLVFSDRDDWRVNRGSLVNAHSVRVPVAGDDRPAVSRRNWRAGRTMVPLIPPRFRPKPRRLRHCHILWEVKSWDWIPPEDPALIRHIRGDLWSVLAVWELTELERLVLSQR